MKKLKIIPFLTFFCVAVGLFSCKKSDESFEPKLLMNVDYIEVTSKTNTYSFEILSNEDLSFSADVDWIEFDTAALAKGKHLVRFTALANEEDERSGTITISTHSLEKQVLVIQEAGLVNIFFVKPGASGTGRSWTDPASIQTALQGATSGSVIHLAEGIYVPSQIITNGETSNPGDRTFEINKNISLIGGYPANATADASPDPQLYKTIFSGKQEDGSESFHVVTISAPVTDGEKVVLDGITIQEGNATDRGINITLNGLQFSRGNGGGMIIGGSVAELKNVDIVENQASAKSGSAGQCAGLYIFGNAQVEMMNCKVNGNDNISNNGGGLWINASKAYIFNSEVNDNSAKGTASGLHAFPDAEVHMYNSKIQNNNNTSFGAGIYVRQNSKAILVNCLITGNVTTSANGGGGVMMYDNCVADIISCTVSANGTPGPGGGIYRRQNTNTLRIFNSVVSGNSQRATSSDVDVYEATAAAPSVRSSVLATKVYSSSGSEISSASFNPTTMFDAAFHLIGNDNPALQYGMDATQLQSLSQTFNPPLNGAIQNDIDGTSRAGKTIMGVWVQ